MDIRPAQPQDFAAILALNEASVAVLTPLDGERLQTIHNQAALHWVVEQDSKIAAFFLAFRKGSPYDGPIYRWFTERYDSFLYIDRIVVDQLHRGSGIGSALYNQVLAYAQENKLSLITCEIDIEPPNASSLRFHQKLGFKTIGTQATANGKKQVALQALEIQAS